MKPFKRRLRTELLEDRLAPSANLDPTFGAGGWANLAISGTNPFLSINAVTVESNGDTVVTGLLQVQSSKYPVLGVARLTPDGHLDSTFGTGGLTTLSISPWVSDATSVTPISVMIRPDGRILVAEEVGGTTWQMAAVQFLSNGTLDTSFGTGGAAILANGTNEIADLSSAVLESNGDTVMAGTVYNSQTKIYQVEVSRLLPNGTLDASFGNAGKVEFSPNPSGFANPMNFVNALAVRPDGRIVIAGAVDDNLNLSTIENIITQLKLDGSIDTTFGTNGIVNLNQFSDGEIVLQSDGAILIASGTQVISGFPLPIYNGPSIPFQFTDFTVMRLLASGAVDNSFGSSGKVVVPLAANGTTTAAISNIALESNGDILLGGTVATASSTSVTGPAQIGVIALKPDGTIDTSILGSNGMVTIPTQDNASVTTGPLLAVQSDGNFIVAGYEGAPFVGRLLINNPEPPHSLLVGGTPDGKAVLLTSTNGQFSKQRTIDLFPGFTGAVHTALADVNGDGVPDLIGAAGPGGGPRVIVIDGKTGDRIADFFAFESSFKGGVSVAAADFNIDGRAELVVTAGNGGGPRVSIFSVGAGGTVTTNTSFFGIDDLNFRGGANASVGDINNDGIPDLVVSAGTGGGSRIAVYDGKYMTNPVKYATNSPVLFAYPKLVDDFYAFDPSLMIGANISVADINGDGYGDLIFGAGVGGGPRVLVVSGKSLLSTIPFTTVDQVPGLTIMSFFAGNSSDRSGVRVSALDINGNGKIGIITGSGPSLPSQVRVYQSSTLQSSSNPTPDQTLDPFAETLPGGVYVG